jgi:soluble lytic murein transglycosylase-like protein
MYTKNSLKRGAVSVVKRCFNIRYLNINVLLFGLVLFNPWSMNFSYGAPIYVYKESDGTIRFTSKTPSKTVKAKVFTAKNANFSFFKYNGYQYNQSLASKVFNFQKYEEIISGASKTHQVDSALLKAVIHAESSLNPRAVSPKGAIGLMQLMPSTAKWLGVKRPFTVEENIHGGAKYLSKLLKKYDGNITFAVAAYNAGELNVDKYRGVPPFSETKNYVKKVLALKDKYTKPKTLNTTQAKNLQQKVIDANRG